MDALAKPSGRWPYCLGEVIPDAEGAELWPGYFWYDEDEDPSPDLVRAVEAYQAAHLRRGSAIWRDA